MIASHVTDRSFLGVLLAFPAILVPALVGALSFAVWLTVKGVNQARWQEKAGDSTASL